MDLFPTEPKALAKSYAKIKSIIAWVDWGKNIESIAETTISDLQSKVTDLNTEIDRLNKLLNPTKKGLSIVLAADLFVDQVGAQYNIFADNIIVKTGQTIAKRDNPEKIFVEGDFSQTKTISIEFLNDGWKEDTQEDRNLIVLGADIDGKVIDFSAYKYVTSYGELAFENNAMLWDGKLTIYLNGQIPEPQTPPVDNTLKDSFNAVWELKADGIAYRDGVATPSAEVKSLVIIDGKARQTNAQGNSWDWIGDKNGNWQAVGAVIVPPPSNDIPQIGDGIVAFHLMVQMGRWDAGNPRRATSDYQAQIKELLDNGTNLIYAYADSITTQLEHFKGMLDAADLLGVGCIGFASLTVEDIPALISFIKANKDRKGVWRSKNGEIAISGYYNVDGSLADAVAQLRAQGISAILFWPDIPWNTSYQTDSERANKAKSLGGQAMFDFGLGLGYSTSKDWISRATLRLAACKAAGIEFVPAIVAHYSGIGGNTQHYWGSGYEGLRDIFKWCLDNKVYKVEVLTANDYNDGTYMGTFGSGNVVIGNSDEPSWVGQILLQTNGHLAFCKRYFDALINKTDPASITKTEVYVAHTLEPKNAKRWDQLTSQEKNGLSKWAPVSPYGPVDFNSWASQATACDAPSYYEDAIFVVVRNTQLVNVTITAGKTSKIFNNVPVGENHLRLEAPNLTFDSNFFGDVIIKVDESATGKNLLNTKSGMPITQWCLPGRRRVFARQLL